VGWVPEKGKGEMVLLDISLLLSIKIEIPFRFTLKTFTIVDLLISKDWVV